MSDLLKKVSLFIFNIWLVITIAFFALRLAPGDPVERILGPTAKVSEYAAMQTRLGLDLPWGQQYKVFLFRVLKGELGESLFSGRPVINIMKERLPPTLILAFCAIMFSAPIGISLGLFFAIKKDKWQDHLGRILSLLMLSFPIFSLAPILVYIFSIQLSLLPVSEWGNFKNAILPILTLTLPLASILSRVVRNKFLEEKNSSWVQVLRAKGLSSLQVNGRILKFCAPTIINVISIQLSVVLSGTIITETIFDIPGIGLSLLEAIQNRDYPVVQGVLIYTTCVYLGVYYLTELINQKLDPRIGARG